MAIKNKELDRALTTSNSFLGDLQGHLRLLRGRSRDAAVAAILLDLRSAAQHVPSTSSRKFLAALDALELDIEPAPAPKSRGGRK